MESEIDLDHVIHNYYARRQHHNTTELCHMMKKHDCDKGLSSHNYSTFYHALFGSVRNEPVRLLEIGHHKQGVSLPVWREYFTRATITAADVEETGGAIPFNQRSADDIDRLFGETGDMDIIIDDGIHEFDANWELLVHAMPYLKEGGVYIIEDLQKTTAERLAERRAELMGLFNLSIFHLMDIPYSENTINNRLLVLQKYKRSPLTIVTASSQDDWQSLVRFLCSLIVHKIPFKEVFVYDLGMEPMTMQILQDMFSAHCIRIRTFNFGKYPAFFTIAENMGQHAWKPVIIEEVAREIGRGILLWCDARRQAAGDLKDLVQLMDRTYLYAPVAHGNLRQWTHPKTLEYFFLPPNDPLNEKIMRDASQVCFHLCPDIMELIEEWSYCAQIRDCIAPLGSDRSNHRQDQSILSILYYRYLRQYPHRMQHVKDDYVLEPQPSG